LENINAVGTFFRLKILHLKKTNMKRAFPLLAIVSTLGLFSFTSCMTSADGQPVANDSSKIAVRKDTVPDASGNC
jgi:hypothetical protein